MFFKRKYFWLLVLTCLVSFKSGVSAGTSHDVSIRVAEIGRYHVENKTLISNGGKLIQAVDVVVLSNTDRKWRFLAVPFADANGVEWSRDSQVWHSFENGIGEVLTGARSDWKSYRFYIRVSEYAGTGLNLGYQLIFNE